MAFKPFSLPAPAKLNLFLHITGTREDGLHTLQSLIVFTDVGDTISFSPHDGFLLDTTGPFAEDLGPPQDNIVYKAARALAAAYNAPLRGSILLEKNLPVASGIGGGSSNAATALLGLVRLWDLPDEPDRLQKIAVTLGADVPSCLIRKPVWAEGAGEKMMRLPGMPGLHLVLATPPVATPTVAVYQGFRGRYSPPLQFMGRRKTMQEWIADLKLYRNDLTDAAIDINPDIKTVLQAIADTPNCQFARMSGSGATCFGVYEYAGAAAAAVNKLRQTHPDWWIVAANLLEE